MCQWNQGGREIITKANLNTQNELGTRVTTFKIRYIVVKEKFKQVTLLFYKKLSNVLLKLTAELFAAYRKF